MSVTFRTDLSLLFAQVVNPITQISDDGAAEETRKIIFRGFIMWWRYHKPQDDWILQRHNFLSWTSELRHRPSSGREGFSGQEVSPATWEGVSGCQLHGCGHMEHCLTLSCSPSGLSKFLSPLLPACPTTSVRYMWAIKYMRLFFSFFKCACYFVFLLEKADGRIYALHLKLNVLTFVVDLRDFGCLDCLRLSFKEVLAQTSFASSEKVLLH